MAQRSNNLVRYQTRMKNKAIRDKAKYEALSVAISEVFQTIREFMKPDEVKWALTNEIMDRLRIRKVLSIDPLTGEQIIRKDPIQSHYERMQTSKLLNQAIGSKNNVRNLSGFGKVFKLADIADIITAIKGPPQQVVKLKKGEGFTYA